MRPGARLAAVQGGKSFSAEALQFFARISDPGPTRKGHYNTLINALVANGVWAKLDALYILAAPDAATALTNLKSSSYGASVVNAPTFTVDRGYAGNGTDSYVDTNLNSFTAGGNYALNNGAFFARQRTIGGTPAFTFCGTIGSFNSWINNAGAGNAATAAIQIDANQPASVGVGPAFWGADRSASNRSDIYRNGVADGSNTTASATSVDNSNWGICRNGQHSTAQIASFAVGASMTADQHAAFAAAELAYMQAVGAV